MSRKTNQPAPPDIMRKGGVHGKSEKAKRKADRDKLKEDAKKDFGE